MEILKAYREEIDNIDKQMTILLEKRLNISLCIGAIKVKNQLPLANPIREREVVENNLLYLDNYDFKDELIDFLNMVMDLSKRIQSYEYKKFNLNH